MFTGTTAYKSAPQCVRKYGKHLLGVVEKNLDKVLLLLRHFDGKPALACSLALSSDLNMRGPSLSSSLQSMTNEIWFKDIKAAMGRAEITNPAGSVRLCIASSLFRVSVREQ